MRRRPSLSEPPADLAGFPTRRLTPRRTLWRIHRRGRDPWWFCSDLNCRFDLPAPMGTCYLAEDPLGSFVEVFTDVTLIAEDDVRGRRLSAVSVPKPVKLADCTDARSRAFGCTGEIHTSTDYGLTQRWAAALAGSGFHGVRYLVRHDPSQRRAGIGLFGEAGRPSAWPKPITEEIDEELVADAARSYGIHVLSRP